MKKIAIITGASSGIGWEFAKQLDRDESFDEIWLIARRKEKLEELAATLKNKARAISLDLCEYSSLGEFKALLENEKPDVKVLVNCSGFGKFGAYSDIEVSDALSMIDLNSRAPVALTEYSLPYMSKGARILQVASIAGFHPIPYLNVYAATKVFLLNYSRALNYELRDRGITVTAVCPGWTKTPFFDVATNGGTKKEVTKYTGMRTAEEMVTKALKCSRKGKDIAVLGLQNNGHRFLAKIVPYSAVMKIWDKIRK
ncbi:MAG: SDR family NAD(P)-dependent oxidoreductase [Oscillospiraceae bacterium]|nr:SDR family NAD(P)-dependent oxidoreductase [Oscillospiraceae bacterium]